MKKFDDRILTCMGCQDKFVFTSGEQEFFASRGFDNIPTRCPACRDERRVKKLIALKKLFKVICSKCGCDTTVPFKPREGTHVYCKECLKEKRK